MSARLLGDEAARPIEQLALAGHEGISIGRAILWATRCIAASGSVTPRLDAEVLLGYILGLSRAQLNARWDELLAVGQFDRYAELVRRRVAHEPVAYLIGQKAFYDIQLYVGRGAFIPRPETEHLVEEALAWARTLPLAENSPLRVVDVGTGSGALAVALARHLPQARMWAVDISAEALAIAARNLNRYGLEGRVLLLCADLLSAFGEPFDLIVANLPYVRRGDLASLPQDIIGYEPCEALDGGEDGLEVIRRLLDQAPGRLAVPGLLLLEIGHGQGKQVKEVAQACLPDATVSLLHDYAGLERVVRVERSCPISLSP